MGWMIPMMAAAQQRQSEERLLSDLIAKDARDQFEYKILHAYGGSLRKPERLQRILKEQRRARWDLVAKLDDSRLVLKRPRSARTYDTISGEGPDPYRTQVGSQRLGPVLTLLGGLGLTMVLALVADSPSGNMHEGLWSVIVTALAVGMLFVLMVAIKRGR